MVRQVEQPSLPNLGQHPLVQQRLVAASHFPATMRQLIMPRTKAGYKNGQCQYDYVVAGINQQVDLEWVSTGVLRQELGVTKEQWAARGWGNARDRGCFLVSAAGGGNFVPGLLRSLGPARFEVWRGPDIAGEDLERVGRAAAVVPAAAPAAVPAVAPAAAEYDDDDNDDDNDEEEEEEEEEEQGEEEIPIDPALLLL